jgi:hypothetical protein
VRGPDIVAKRTTTYLWQYVIGLGFLSGIWTAIGINPGAVILNVLGQATEAIWPDPLVQRLFLVIPVILLIISIVQAYRKGGILGLVAVIVAYVAGLSILVNLWTTILILAAAIVTGYLATNRRLMRKLTGR